MYRHILIFITDTYTYIYFDTYTHTIHIYIYTHTHVSELNIWWSDSRVSFGAPHPTLENSGCVSLLNPSTRKYPSAHMHPKPQTKKQKKAANPILILKTSQALISAVEIRVPRPWPQASPCLWLGAWFGGLGLGGLGAWWLRAWGLGLRA